MIILCVHSKTPKALDLLHTQANFIHRFSRSIEDAVLHLGENSGSMNLFIDIKFLSEQNFSVIHLNILRDVLRMLTRSWRADN